MTNCGAIIGLALHAETLICLWVMLKITRQITLSEVGLELLSPLDLTPLVILLHGGYIVDWVHM